MRFDFALLTLHAKGCLVLHGALSKPLSFPRGFCLTAAEPLDFARQISSRTARGETDVPLILGPIYFKQYRGRSAGFELMEDDSGISISVPRILLSTMFKSIS